MKLQDFLWIALIGLLLIIPVAAQPDNTCEAFVGNADAAAPEFPTDADWINVDGSLTLTELAGKIVLLDFWTYGCINCLHMIPTLHDLEKAYADELVVVGVHSAKFDNEGQTENIRQIVQRYEMEHPVINDADFRVWNSYRRFGVNAWPTFVVIDPRGNVFASQAGEVPYEAFDQVIGTMADCFRANGELNTAPIDKIAPELTTAPPRILNYPGKVLADPAGNRLFIADSVNHRVVIADLQTYEVLATIGTGQQGYADGGYDTAQFYKPQGMAIQGDTLYLADTFNHTIRAIDLTEQTVTTIAGTGVQGRRIPQTRQFPALATDLRSPWDVTFGDNPDTLYIAMAGTHQIWQIDLQTMVMQWTVGNGREAQLNQTLLTSELAQPSGLHYDDDKLYFADSESSTIRVANFTADTVQVVSGTTENSLFIYGDVDGPPGQSLLQHALGVTGDRAGTLYLADTYNSKIKRVTPADNITTTLSGDAPGYADGPLSAARFNEPGGLDYADGRLYIADTNNHAVRVIDLETEQVTTVTFPNPQALQIENRATLVGGNVAGDTTTLDPQTVASGSGELIIDLLLPEGYKINDLAPSVVQLGSVADTLQPEATRYTLQTPSITIPVMLQTGEGTLRVDVDLYYCEAVNETLCFIESFTADLPITVRDDAPENALVIQQEVVVPQGFGDGFGG